MQQLEVKALADEVGKFTQEEADKPVKEIRRLRLESPSS